MNKILKIIKVNVLGLIAIPLLLITTGVQLMQKSLEKVALLLGIGVTLIFLALFSLVIKYPGEFFNGLGTFIIVLVVFGGIILTIILALLIVGSIGTFMVTFITGIVSILLVAVFDMADALYEIIYTVCQEDMESLCEEETKYKWFCPGFLLLKGISKLIINVLSLAVWIGGIGCVVAIGYSYLAINNRINELFGIGVLAYLKMFPKVEMVFAIIYYVVLVLGFVVIAMIIIAEWAEMGQKLRAVTQNYEKYIEELDVEELSSYKDYLNCTINEGKLEERYQQYLEVLDELMTNVEDIKEQVELMMTIKKDTYIVYNLGEYIATLENISTQFSSCNHQMAANTFEKHVIPLIVKAEKLYKQLSVEVLKVLSTAAHHNTSVETQSFFSGCDTIDDYKKRYHALSKIYHPDEGGDHETFIRLKTEYDNKINTMHI